MATKATKAKKRPPKTRVYEVSGGVAVVLSARASKMFADAIARGGSLYLGCMAADERIRQDITKEGDR